MGWEALACWGSDARRLERLSGGVANDVWTVQVGGRVAVGRLGSRTDADLDWETRLMRHLNDHGMSVPLPVATADGRLFVDGLTVLTYVEGVAPRSASDWGRVGQALRRLHDLTRGWPQRPGWRSSADLLRAERGTRVDLGAMPPEAVRRCRAAWARLSGRPTCVVHGNPTNPANVRLTAERVTLLDWDESHLDVADLDLALPGDAARLGAPAYDIAVQAAAAWEATVCWDDDHARRQLAVVRPSEGDDA